MRRILIFRLGTQDVHLPKLMGAFIIIATMLMTIQAITSMFDSWENVKAVHACIDAANTGSVRIQDCQTHANYAFGILLHANQYRLTDLQLITALFPKVANVFFWVAGLTIGLLLYRSWKIMIPIEEEVGNIRTPRWRKKK